MVLFLPAFTLFGQKESIVLKKQNVICGADRTELYFKNLEGKKIGFVGNKSSVISEVHMVDTLIASGVDIIKVFCPEHGFRGEGEAGEVIADHIDLKTGVPVISVYGSKKKPSDEDLSGIDVLVFDIQDVGARFYTYISTLHYIMEAAAENRISIIVLDRPNPNGFYVDGPIRQDKFKSFVGMHPVPVVHGMTIGEYALMINGEKWLDQGIRCQIEVVPCLNYDHLTEYILPIVPSPNLPNQASVYLYPSLCFFEGTKLSIGRGTPTPFQVYGHPDYKGTFEFEPVPVPGASMNPKLKNQICKGVDLSIMGVDEIFRRPELHLEWVIDAYVKLGKPEDFFTRYFDTLAGTDMIRKMIQKGRTAAEIQAAWRKDVEKFQVIRSVYLLYPEC